MLVSFLYYASIRLYIPLKKHLVEKLSKVLKMELKMHTPVGPKFVFIKIKHKVLHYVQRDFILRRLELSKDQASMF